MFGRLFITASLTLFIASCGSTPPPVSKPTSVNVSAPTPKGAYTLPDRNVFLQKDPRWQDHKLGGSGESLASDGCLLTATAMTLANLGFQTNPGDLNARLKKANGYTKQGWLKWASLGDVTGGKAKARFYTDVSDDIIEGCMADGFYPLARFDLPNGRSHWGMILHRDAKGYHMRDPLRPSIRPLIFPSDARGFKAVRCVGLAQ